MRTCDMHLAQYLHIVASHECLLSQIFSILLFFSVFRNFLLLPSWSIQINQSPPEISSPPLKLFLCSLCDLIFLIFKMQELNWMPSPSLLFMTILRLRLRLRPWCTALWTPLALTCLYHIIKYSDLILGVKFSSKCAYIEGRLWKLDKCYYLYLSLIL